MIQKFIADHILKRLLTAVCQAVETRTRRKVENFRYELRAGDSIALTYDLKVTYVLRFTDDGVVDEEPTVVWN